MIQYKGTVGYVNEKVWGTKTLYSFTLNGTQGFFRLGSKKPAFKVNGYVEFMADDKLNVVGEVTSLAERAPEVVTGSQTSVPNQAGIPVARNFREEENKVRQTSIHFQSAHKDAIEVAKFMVDKGMINVGKTASKQYGIFLEYLNELTNYFYTQFEAGKTDVDPPNETGVTTATEEPANNE